MVECPVLGFISWLLWRCHMNASGPCLPEHAWKHEQQNENQTLTFSPQTNLQGAAEMDPDEVLQGPPRCVRGSARRVLDLLRPQSPAGSHIP